MAVPVIQSRSEQKESSTTNTTTITAPSGIVDDDVLVICISTDGNSFFTFPSGFTVLNQGEGPSGRCALGIAFKIASSESGNYTVTWTGGNEKAISEMYRIDGAASEDQIQDSAETNTGSSSTATITPAVTTDTEDSLVMVIMGMDDDDITVDSGGDADYTTEDVDESDSGAGSCSIGVQSRSETSKAVPPQCDLTLTASEEFRAYWFAVRSVIPQNRLELYSPVMGEDSPELDLSGKGNTGAVTGTTEEDDGPPVQGVHK